MQGASKAGNFRRRIADRPHCEGEVIGRHLGERHVHGWHRFCRECALRRIANHPDDRAPGRCAARPHPTANRICIPPEAPRRHFTDDSNRRRIDSIVECAEGAAGDSERETERRQHRGSLEPAKGEPEIVP